MAYFPRKKIEYFPKAALDQFENHYLNAKFEDIECIMCKR